MDPGLATLTCGIWHLDSVEAKPHHLAERGRLRRAVENELTDFFFVWIFPDQPHRYRAICRNLRRSSGDRCSISSCRIMRTNSAVTGFGRATEGTRIMRRVVALLIPATTTWCNPARHSRARYRRDHRGQGNRPRNRRRYGCSAFTFTNCDFGISEPDQSGSVSLPSAFQSGSSRTVRVAPPTR